MGRRNNRHWLKANEIKGGLKEQQAWINVGMEDHKVELSYGVISHFWIVAHWVREPGGKWSLASSMDLCATLTEARAAFSKEAKH